MSKSKVVITDHVFPDLQPEMAALADVADIVVAPQGATLDDVAQIASDADALLNCYVKLTPEFVSSLSRCRIIARYGIGVDTVPLEAATAKRIHVTNVPDYCIEEVADHALALTLSLLRGIVRGLDQTRGGGWNIKELMPLRRLRGRQAVVLGFGRIARAFADRARALGFNLAAYDPHLPDKAFADAGVRRVSLDEAFAIADVLSVHAPLTPQTHHLVNEARLSEMKRDAVLVNTSRGGLVDLKAVKRALVNGQLGGAGLDVMEVEPPPADIGIADVPNLIVTPHLAFYSEEAMKDLQASAAAEVSRVLRGSEPRNPVNRI